MSAIITIEFVVPMGYQPGDYAYLHGNGGSGAIDWDTPVDGYIYDLFPGGAGIYGFGRAPFGRARFGHAHSMRAGGFGLLPFGRAPFGYGSALIKARHEVDSCGDYLFGFKCYDKLGNPHEGEPEEAAIEVHIAPPAPTGLKKNAYDKDTDVLVLDAL